METPICDFVRRYAESGTLRLHMPGHKGMNVLGMEQWDLTEIPGADSLYEASGIIARSESNASGLFGCDTYYSTEGSSQCIRAMLYLATRQARAKGRRPLVAAARNVHKTFLSAAALLDFDVMWLYSQQPSYLSCVLEPEELEKTLTRAGRRPDALYLTSPDYLGNVTDIAAIARVCRRHGMLLVVDNAHGAYLRFLPDSLHPMDLGADLCCDSAHKTLPVLTGGAYLHVAAHRTEITPAQIREAMALFGSTSPSYLILQSLDRANAYLAAGYREKLAAFLPRVEGLKRKLTSRGFHLTGTEPLKITLAPKSCGYTGAYLVELLMGQGVVCEFSDPDFVVFMLTPELGQENLTRLEAALEQIPAREPVEQQPPVFHRCETVMSVREAVFSSDERLPVDRCEGKILASPSVGCPPAVPIAVCGERLDGEILAAFRYYGIEEIPVVTESP